MFWTFAIAILHKNNTINNVFIEYYWFSSKQFKFIIFEFEIFQNWNFQNHVIERSIRNAIAQQTLHIESVYSNLKSLLRFVKTLNFNKIDLQHLFLKCSILFIYSFVSRFKSLSWFLRLIQSRNLSLLANMSRKSFSMLCLRRRWKKNDSLIKKFFKKSTKSSIANERATSMLTSTSELNRLTKRWKIKNRRKKEKYHCDRANLIWLIEILFLCKKSNSLYINNNTIDLFTLNSIR